MLFFGISAALTLFIVGSLVALWAAGDRSRNRLAEVTGSLPSARNLAEQQPPVGVRLLGLLRQKFVGTDEGVRDRLQAAGFRNAVHQDFYFGARVLSPVATVALATFVSKENLVPTMLVFGAVGFFLPDLWLSQKSKWRREELRLSLPDVVDLLVICMEAGLGMDQALIRVSQELRHSHGILAEELLIVQREQRAGKSRVDAWRSLAERTQLDVVDQLVNMLVQTERFGTPIARALGQFADGLRLQR